MNKKQKVSFSLLPLGSRDLSLALLFEEIASLHFFLLVFLDLILGFGFEVLGGSLLLLELLLLDLVVLDGVKHLNEMLFFFLLGLQYPSWAFVKNRLRLHGFQLGFRCKRKLFLQGFRNLQLIERSLFSLNRLF